MAPRFFLAFFILTSSLVVGQSPKYALKGGKVSLKPDIAGLPDGILWKLDGNKVVEFNGKEEQVYSAFDKRITLGWVSAELQITDLRFEDSGEYELEVEVKKALHHRSFHKLEVIDEVAKPTISCEMNNGSSSKSSAELECSSESRRPQSLTKFEWSTRGNVQPGPKLRISLEDERDDEVYSCSVSNPLSRETATFTAKDCYPEKSSSVALIASLVSIFVLLLVGVGVGVGIWFCKRHHKACFAKGDLEKQPPPDTTEGSDTGDVNEALLNRAPTFPSTQRLRPFDQGSVKDKAKWFNENKGGQTSYEQCQTENHTEEHKTASPPSPPPSESPSPLDLNNPASNDNRDADADQNGEPSEEEVPQDDPSDSEKANEPNPADVSDKLSEDAQSNSEFIIAPEPPAIDMDKQEEEPLTGRSPAVDMDKQEEELPKGRSPGTCDVDGKYVTPQKGHVKDKRKLFGDRRHHSVGQTLFKKMQTEEHKRTASPPSPPPSEAPSLDLNADADQYREPAEEEVPQYDPSDSEKANEPDPAGVSDKLSEDVKSDPEFTIAPEPPAVDMDKQEEEPLTGRSPACDVDGEYETPQKGHVKDEIKRLNENKGGQTPFKQWQTDQYGEPAVEEVPEVDPSDSEKANEPNPAGVSDKLSEDAQSDREFSMVPKQPAVDMDKQEEEPLKVRSPACDVDGEYVTPQKGHVKDEIKRLNENKGGQTPFKQWQTENHTKEHKTASPPHSPPPSEAPSPLDLNNPASNDNRDADADQNGESAEEEVQHYDPSDSKKANEPDPAGVPDKLSEDAQSDPESTITPEPPGHVKDEIKLFEDRLNHSDGQTLFKKMQTEEHKRTASPPSPPPKPEKEADDKEKPATSETSPAVQPHSPATKSSSNMALEDTAGEHEEDADSDQVTGGTAEENVREADSSEKNVSDDSSEDELSSTIPEQRGSKTSLHDKNLSQEEANTNKDNQQETVKPVSKDEDESDKEPDLNVADSQQPKSPTPTKSDNGNADTPQESPDAANADPDNRKEEEEEPKS